MAKQDYVHRLKKRINRKGRHSKSRTSFNKGSDLYQKKYRGQGK